MTMPRTIEAFGPATKDLSVVYDALLNAELAIADKFRESAHRPAALATARTAALT